jgi:hypothetical protein
MVMGVVFIMEGVVTLMLRFMMQVAMFDSRRKLLKDELQKETAKQPQIFGAMSVGKDLRDQVQDGGAEEQASTKGKQPLKTNRVRGALV